MSVKDFIVPTGRIDRGRYALAGILLFALKYNLDRLLARRLFRRDWSLWSYLDVPGLDSISAIAGGDALYGLTLVAVALPFVWIGTVLTIRRLRDAGFPLWLVLGFFAPALNLILFAVLSVVPSVDEPVTGERAEPARSRLDRFIPEGQLASAAMAVGLTVPAGVIGTLIAVNLFESYGWGLFVGLPFGLGMVAALIHGYHKERTAAECFSVGLSSVAVLGGILALVAAEGLICLFMAAPIALSLAVIGSGMGYVMQRRPDRPRGTAAASLAVLLVVPGFIVIEGLHDRPAPLVAVSTTVTIEAPPEEVWGNLVAFSEIPPPQEWLFRVGIAYPLRATIDGTGVGAVRRCEFTTGAFVEPITVWEEPRELAFSVESMPDPMQEWTFYGDIRPAHIDGYFRTERGRFLLEQSENGTLLTGTTWYRNRMWPNRYWNVWADAILHRIHLRVLRHIKVEAES